MIDITFAVICIALLAILLVLFYSLLFVLFKPDTEEEENDFITKI